MDLIASHQQGLIEQLELDVAALAGAPREHAQRAAVLHHLYDHSRGQHGWALLAARDALRCEAAIETMGKWARRLAWTLPGARRLAADERCQMLIAALRERERMRCASLYRTYRLSAAAALRGEAQRAVDPGLLEALDRCHEARRRGRQLAREDFRALARESADILSAEAGDGPVAAALDALDWPVFGWLVRRGLRDEPPERIVDRADRKGWARIEAELRASPRMPRAFRANPAQHFYALQHSLAERRRKQWRRELDRELDAELIAA